MRPLTASLRGLSSRIVSSRIFVPSVNKLSDEERARILALVISPEFASQPPSQIVPTLVDRGEYLASESTIYRVMKAAAQQHHRGRAKRPATEW